MHDEQHAQDNVADGVGERPAGQPLGLAVLEVSVGIHDARGQKHAAGNDSDAHQREPRHHEQHESDDDQGDARGEQAPVASYLDVHDNHNSLTLWLSAIAVCYGDDIHSRSGNMRITPRGRPVSDRIALRWRCVS